MKTKKTIILIILIGLYSCLKDDPSNSRILELGIPLDELIKKGISIEKLYYAGATVKELVDANAPLPDILAIKEVTLRDLVFAPAPIDDLMSLLKDGYVSFQEMLEAGMGIGILSEAGYCEELKALGFYGVLSDYDGNQYNWVKIGKQLWMKENLRVTHYADGRGLEEMEVGNPAGILAYNSKFYIDPFSHEVDNNHAYARIVNPSIYYSWAAAADTSSILYYQTIQGICPDGWRLPNSNDIIELTDFVNENYPYELAYNSLCSDTLWEKNYIKGNNYFGLSIMPNGFYYYDRFTGFSGNHYNPWSFIIWTVDGSLIVDDLENIERVTYWGIHGMGWYFSTADKITQYCVRCLKD